MFDVRFTIRAPDWERLRRAVLEQLEDASEATAHGCVESMTSLMQAGLDPDGRAQKPNPPGVVEDKEGRPPLVESGTLSDPSRYSVVPAGSPPHSFIVRPPASRETVIPELRRRGYRLFYIGEPVRRLGREYLSQAVTAAARRIVWRDYA
jgi:hypothetical protein